MVSESDTIAGPVVIFYISEQKDEFPIHYAKLKRHAPSLASLVSEQQQQPKTITRVNWGSPAFKNFSQFCYGLEIMFAPLPSGKNTIPAALKSYLLSKEIKSVRFGNAILHQAQKLASLNGVILNVPIVNAVYKTTQQRSGFRKWVVEECILDRTPQQSWIGSRRLDRDFLRDMMIENRHRLLKYKPEPRGTHFERDEKEPEVIDVDADHES